jgi:hypothetical protein
MPGPRLLKVSRLGVSTAKTLRLARANLETLGVDMTRYGERDYRRTQNIGAALAFLELEPYPPRSNRCVLRLGALRRLRMRRFSSFHQQCTLILSASAEQSPFETPPVGSSSR